MFPSTPFYALIIHPKKEFIDWVNYIFPDSKVSFPFEDKHDHGTVYLIPNFYNHYDAIEWLKLNYIPILENAFWGWCTDETLWPDPPSWELFERFLDYELQSCVHHFEGEE